MADQALDQALAGLQATASQFAVSLINDERIRHQYSRDVSALSNELRAAVESGRISVGEAAEKAVALRNQIMEVARLQTSPTVLAHVKHLKRNGHALADLSEKYARKKYGKRFSALSEQHQTNIYKTIIESAGRPNQDAMQLAHRFGRTGRRLLLVSLAIAVYEVAEAESKGVELARQSVLVGASITGGWIAGNAAIAVSACAVTGPVCVGAMVFVGGLLAAYGAEAAFGSLYPRPAR